MRRYALALSLLAACIELPTAPKARSDAPADLATDTPSTDIAQTDTLSADIAPM